MHLFGTIIFSSLLALSWCQATPEDEMALRLRVQEYARHWADQRYDRVWSVMSPHLRETEGNDVEKFAAYIRESGFILVEQQLQKIKIQDNKATVVTLTKFFSKIDNKTFEDVDEQYWVKVGGKWYYDRRRTIK